MRPLIVFIICLLFSGQACENEEGTPSENSEANGLVCADSLKTLIGELGLTGSFRIPRL